MLGSDVVLDAGGRFESHGTTGAFVEHVAMSLLDVRLHRVQPAKHHLATGTSAPRERETGKDREEEWVNKQHGKLQFNATTM